MAKEEAATEGQEEEGGKSPVMLIAIAAIASLAIGAGGAFFVLGGSSSEADTGPPPPTAEELLQAKAEEIKARMYALEPFVVNVGGDELSRYLKVKVEFEAQSAELIPELEARLSQVRDTLIVLLSSKRLSEVSDFEGKALLKEDIQDRVNDLLESGKIESVLFTEFVVQ